MATNSVNLNEGSPSVQTHLGIIQNVIQRMAANSASCKTWCITLVAAILVVMADKGDVRLTILAAMPIVLFAWLDIYYLALENGFRNSYNAFIKKVHDGNLSSSDLYSLAPTGSSSTLYRKAVRSPSIWGFYVSLLALAAITVAVIG